MALQEQRNAVARFLDARDMKQEALEIATDPDYRFDLAVSLGELGIALELAEVSGSELKWRQLGELALSAGKLQVRRLAAPDSGRVFSHALCSPLSLTGAVSGGGETLSDAQDMQGSARTLRDSCFEIVL